MKQRQAVPATPLSAGTLARRHLRRRRGSPAAWPLLSRAPPPMPFARTWQGAAWSTTPTSAPTQRASKGDNTSDTPLAIRLHPADLPRQRHNSPADSGHTTRQSHSVYRSTHGSNTTLNVLTARTTTAFRPSTSTHLTQHTTRVPTQRRAVRADSWPADGVPKLQQRRHNQDARVVPATVPHKPRRKAGAVAV